MIRCHFLLFLLSILNSPQNLNCHYLLIWMQSVTKHHNRLVSLVSHLELCVLMCQILILCMFKWDLRAAVEWKIIHNFSVCSSRKAILQSFLEFDSPCSLYGKDELGYISPLCFTEESIWQQLYNIFGWSIPQWYKMQFVLKQKVLFYV